MDDVSDNFNPDGQWLVPNASPFPSLEVNNARFAPFVGRDGPVSLGTVRETIAVEAPDQSTAFTPQGPANMLASLRAKYPFLPIMPLPPVVRPLALTANIAQDLIVPDGATIMNLTASADYYLSLHGNAEVPSATNTGQAAIGTPGESKAFKVSPGIWYFVGGLSSIGCISPVACIITANFYIHDEMPR